MADTYYWASGDVTDTSLMATTASFNDGMVGDTLTGEDVSGSHTFGGSCGAGTASAGMTALCDIGCPGVLSALSVTLSAQVVYNTSFCPISGGDPDAEFTYAQEAEYFNGSTWVPITLTGTLSYSLTGGATRTARAAGTLTASGLSVTATKIRIYNSAEFADTNASVTNLVTVEVTDFRVTYVTAAPQSAPTLTGPSICEGTQNTLTWSAVPCATSYQIQIGSGTPISVGMDLSYVDTPVTLGVALDYKVRAVNAGGNGPWSSTVTATACAVAVEPLAPTVYVLGTCEGEQVTVWIEASAGATGWELYRSDPAGGPFLIKTFTERPTAEDPWIDTPKAIGVTYTYYAIATNSIGDSPASANVTATPCLSVCAKTVWRQERCV